MKQKKGFVLDAFEVALKVLRFGLKFLLFTAVLYLAWDLGFFCLAYQNCRADMAAHYVTMSTYGLGIVSIVAASVGVAMLLLQVFLEFHLVQKAISVIAVIALWFFWGAFGNHWLIRLLVAFSCFVLVIATLYYPLLVFLRENIFLRIVTIAGIFAGIYFGWSFIVSAGLIGWIILLFFVFGTLLVLLGVEGRSGSGSRYRPINAPESNDDGDYDNQKAWEAHITFQEQSEAQARDEAATAHWREPR